MKKDPKIEVEVETNLKTKNYYNYGSRDLSLLIKLKDDTKQNSNEAIGLATYSNSKSTVLSFASIFETL